MARSFVAASHYRLNYKGMRARKHLTTLLVALAALAPWSWFYAAIGIFFVAVGCATLLATLLIPLLYWRKVMGQHQIQQGLATCELILPPGLNIDGAELLLSTPAALAVR
jgi:hypothetical protein